MRRIIALLLLTAPAAQAGLPLYNTDMIKAGEALASFSSRHAELQSDIYYTIVGNPTIGEPLRGIAETTTRNTSLHLVFGLSNDVNGYLLGGFSESDLDSTLRGHFTSSLPIEVRNAARQEGYEDLGVGLEFRLFANEFSAVVGRLGVFIPTASDYGGAMAEIVNGVQFSTLKEGRRGRGYTRMSPQLAGSTRLNLTALEWEVSITADDEKSTEDVYQAQLGVLQHLGTDAYLRLTGAAAWQKGMHTEVVSTNNVAGYSVTFTGGYFFTPIIRLAASYSYGWADDVEAKYVSGNTMVQYNQEQESIGLGLAYMLP